MFDNVMNLNGYEITYQVLGTNHLRVVQVYDKMTDTIEYPKDGRTESVFEDCDGCGFYQILETLNKWE